MIDHSGRRCKHTHILGHMPPVVSWGPNLQSPTSQFSGIYLLGLSFLVGSSLQINLLEQTYIVLSHFLSNPVSSICIDGTMLAAVTMPTSV